MKTPWCSSKNNGLFLWKRRVVLWKVTCCFPRMFGCGKNYRWITNQKLNFSKCENIYNHPLSRARVRAHYMSFYIFAVTSVTGGYVICYFSGCYWVFWACFNKYTLQSTSTLLKTPRKIYTSCLLFLLFRGLIFPLLWHLWQQKNNIAVGRRARTRVREEENGYNLNLLSALCKIRVKKNILSLFPRFFTLWGLFDPYMYRDAFTLRIPNLQFYFHGYGQSNISIFYVPYKFLHRLCIQNRRATNAAFEGWGRNCWLNPNQWFDANKKMKDDTKLFLMIFIISQTEISGFTPIYQTFW